MGGVMPRALFALFFFRLVGEAMGQEIDYDALNFRGLKVVRLAVEALDQDSKDCGLKRETLETAVTLPLNAYTKLQIAPSSLSGTPVIVISVATAKDRTGCHFAYN